MAYICPHHVTRNNCRKIYHRESFTWRIYKSHISWNHEKALHLGQLFHRSKLTCPPWYVSSIVCRIYVIMVSQENWFLVVALRCHFCEALIVGPNNGCLDTFDNKTNNGGQLQIQPCDLKGKVCVKIKETRSAAGYRGMLYDEYSDWVIQDPVLHRFQNSLWVVTLPLKPLSVPIRSSYVVITFFMLRDKTFFLLVFQILDSWSCLLIFGHTRLLCHTMVMKTGKWSTATSIAWTFFNIQ